MAKRKYGMTGKKAQRRRQEGRGRGEGADYKPWVKIHDVPSRGRVARILGMTTGRIHHFLSDGEAGFFTQCDWQDHITDIWEQYPLDEFKTVRIARRLKIRHPAGEDGLPCALTTDFVLVIGKGADRRVVPRTFKQTDELEDRRVLEKFEIERVYWSELGVSDWGIATEDDLDKVLIRNIETVRPFLTFKGQVEPYPGCYADAVWEVYSLFPSSSQDPLTRGCEEVDYRMQVPRGTALNAAKHLIANKVLFTDMHDSRPIPERPLTAFHALSIAQIHHGP